MAALKAVNGPEIVDGWGPPAYKNPQLAAGAILPPLFFKIGVQFPSDALLKSNPFQPASALEPVFDQTGGERCRGLMD